MKLTGTIRRWIAMMLIIAISLSALTPKAVYAFEKEAADDILEEIVKAGKNMVEATAEAREDAKSSVQAGDWGTAIYTDHLPWCVFHVAVQLDIVKKNSIVGEISKEMRIDYVDKNNKKTGKWGRADIAVNDGKNTFLWEVKPYSYSQSPKKELGEAQLALYVASDTNYYIGTNQIKDGEFIFLVISYHRDYTEYISYTVKYMVGSNGLILYTFQRNSVERVEEPNEEYDMAYYPHESKVYAYAEVLEPVYDYNNEESTVNVPQLLQVVAFATVWQAANERINRNPDTNNSLSDGIIIACEKFKTAVMKYMAQIRYVATGTAGAAGVFVFSGQEAQAAELNAAFSEFMDAVEVYADKDLADQLLKAVMEGDEEKFNELLKLIQGESEDFDKAGEAQPPRDPLVIDLGATGIELHSLENGVYFDLDNNGFAERTAWIGTEDGFLALDRNGNGRIDNGGELFGDQVILESGRKSSSGFEALAELDENEDRAIDSQDAAYEQLQVWVDTNHNGTSESNELWTLAELEIQTIHLNHREISFIDDETGTRIAETADVKISRCDSIVTVEISEFWFPVNASDTTHGSTVTVGNVPTIEQAMEADESGKLQQLVEHFRSSDDIVEKRYDVKQILYFLTEASEIAPNSRGGNIDARDLAVIEAFMGREFNGVDGTSPNVNAAAILKEICIDIENRYYSILNLNAELGGYLYAAFPYEEEDGKENLNLSLLYYRIDTRIAEEENVDTMLYDLLVYLQSYDAIHGTDCFRTCSDYYASRSPHYAELVELSKAGSIYIGTSGDDSCVGTGRNDFIFGEEGNDGLSGGSGVDVIYGKAGNDVLNGNAGNDHLYGGEGDDVLDGGTGDDILEDNGGNDVYVFTKGYGTDRIIDNGGSNTLRFANLTAKDILVNGTDEFDVTIQIKGTSDKLIIQNFREQEELADYTLEFQDQTMHCTDAGSPFRHIYGSDSDDRLQAAVADSMINAFVGNDTISGSKGQDVIYGNEGNDQIDAGEGNDAVYGGSGADVLSGEAGDDILFGEDGQDVLDGGAGDDFLYGGSGDDTYVFAKGYGTDIIEDMEGVSTIRLSDDLTLADIVLFPLGDEAVIRIQDTEDMCIISGYGRNPSDYLLSVGAETIYVKDGMSEVEEGLFPELKLISGTETSDAIFGEAERSLISAGAQYDYIVGSPNQDLIFGDGDTDRILAGDGNDVIYGGEGNDQLYGEEGSDFLAGGSENDYINGGAGNDILLSGSGDDFMEGGAGDDVYYFCAGDGRDSILDKEGNNVIVLGDGFSSDTLKAYRSNWNDLLITFEGQNDTLIIKDYCVDEAARSFRLVFADGRLCFANDSDSVLRSIYDTYATEYMPTIYTDGIILISSNGDDELAGSEASDTLIGGNGNNRILGNGGDDSLDGGLGKDYLSGGPGCDTYIYRKGYGTDTICDSEGMNTVEIYGYAASDVQVYRTNWNDITLVMDGSGEAGLWNDAADKIVIEGFFTAEACRNFYLSFDGAVVPATAVGSPLRTLNGTEGSDYMTGFDNGCIILYGGEGGDTLNGSAANDELYGGNGDDRILGAVGDDILNGGNGNDMLEGGEGNDTYMFDADSGTDIIDDSLGTNVLSFGEGLALDGMQVSRSDWNDLAITFTGMEDRIIIRGYFVSEENRRFELVFADGTRFAWDDVENPLIQCLVMEENEGALLE